MSKLKLEYIRKNKSTDRMEGEYFLDYPHNPQYMVSNYGRVYSKPKQVNHNHGGIATKKARIMTQTDNGSGYLSVGLTKNGKTKTTRVSRMVALTFLDNLNNKPAVNHKNGNKYDNRVENLEWATHGENVMHAWRTGLSEKKEYKALQEKLRYILPYSTHDVLVQTPNGVGKVILDQSKIRIEYKSGGLENLVKGVRYWGDEFKLCLRSLSDLTKEIEHNGEKFVPIPKLAEIAFSNCDTENDWKLHNDVAVSSAGLSFGYEEVRKFYVSDSDFNMYYSEYDLMQKLLEWHFDIFGGIGSGWAIDINTLEK